MKPYRQNVGAILKRPSRSILMAERIDLDDAWQFPQGGVDPGESRLDAPFAHDRHHTPEFQSTRWVHPSRALDLIVPMKRAVLEQTFAALAQHLDLA